MKRHKWLSTGPNAQTCARRGCGVVRWRVPADGEWGPMFNYEWPNGRKCARSSHQPVPMCDGEERL
jgi:hypothetical protein